MNACNILVLTALVASLVIAWTFFGVNATWAQDVTGEPETVATVEATAEAPADIVVEDGGTLVINEQPAEPAPAPERTFDFANAFEFAAALFMAIAAGGGFLVVLQNFLSSKKTKDTTEKAFLDMRPTEQEAVKGLVQVAVILADLTKRVADFGLQVTDGKPNQETPPNPPAL